MKKIITREQLEKSRNENSLKPHAEKTDQGEKEIKDLTADDILQGERNNPFVKY